MLAKFLTFISAVSLLMTGCIEKSKTQAASTPSEEPLTSQQQEQSEQSADEMLSSFTVSGYTKGGKKQWDLEGKSADIMTEEIKLTDVTGRVYGKEMNMTIVADKGSLNRVDNNVHLEQDVQATTEDGATLITDYLDWDAQNQKLSSDAPVWIKRGIMEASGKGIIGQPGLNLAELKKDVTVKISMQKEAVLKSQKLSKEIGQLTQKQDVDNSIAVTVINCDGPLEVEYQNNLAIFQDNVRVKDNRGEIFADKMDVYFTVQSEATKQIEGMEGMGIEKIVAEGSVEIHHGGNISYSEKALYDTDTGKLTLTGKPKLVIYSTEAFSQAMGEKGQQ